MKRAFTLIELLVVITIIVVLLAMLTPALNDALYAAKVAACAAQQDTMLNGATQYSFEYKRSYFFRAAAGGTGHVANDRPTAWWTNQIMGLGPHASGAGQSAEDFDDRPVMRPYIQINALVDPMSDTGIDLDVDVSQTREPKLLRASYAIWVGGRFDQQGMTRLGSRLVYGRYKFDVLFSDMHEYQNGDGPNAEPVVYSSHGDREGRFSLQETNPFWKSSSRGHGPMAVNHAFQDGSVRNYSNFEMPTDDQRRNPLGQQDTTYALFKPAPILMRFPFQAGSSTALHHSSWLPER